MVRNYPLHLHSKTVESRFCLTAPLKLLPENLFVRCKPKDFSFYIQNNSKLKLLQNIS